MRSDEPEPSGGEHGPELIRAFFALDPPSGTIAAVADWQRTALGGDLRPLGRDLHITLAFLGSRTAPELETAERVLREATRGIGAVRVRLEPTPLALPRRRPRVIALAADSPGAAELHRSLAAGLGAAGVELADERPYRPHLSVARVRGKPQTGRRRRVDAGAIEPFCGPGGHTFDAVRVALYRSELRSQGARYSVLADVELPPAGGG